MEIFLVDSGCELLDLMKVVEDHGFGFLEVGLGVGGGVEVGGGGLTELGEFLLARAGGEGYGVRLGWGELLDGKTFLDKVDGAF